MLVGTGVPPIGESELPKAVTHYPNQLPITQIGYPLPKSITQYPNRLPNTHVDIIRLALI